MRQILAPLMLLGALLAVPSQAAADCVCRCVDGEMEAVCSNSFEARPSCPSRACEIPSPRVAPVESPRVPPVGTTKCQQAQVFENGRYVWRDVCR